MQWQIVAEAKAKDKTKRIRCPPEAEVRMRPFKGTLAFALMLAACESHDSLSGLPSLAGYHLGEPFAAIGRAVPCSRDTSYTSGGWWAPARDVRYCQPSDSVQLFFVFDTLVEVAVRWQNLRASPEEFWKSPLGPVSRPILGDPDSVSRVARPIAGEPDDSTVELRVLWHPRGSPTWWAWAYTVVHERNVTVSSPVIAVDGSSFLAIAGCTARGLPVTSGCRRQ